MRTTINLDEELLAKATKLGDPMGRSALINEGLKAFVQRESAIRLAKLGGSQSELAAAPRKRPNSKIQL